MASVRILIIGYVWPEPASSAAGGRMLQLIEAFLGHGWQVSFASPAQRGPHRAAIEALGVEAFDVALNCASFDRFCKAQAPDIVMFDRFMIEEQFGWRVAEHCPAALRILDTEDLHSLRAARQRAFKAGRPVSTADLNGEMAQREIAAVLRSDLSLIISEAEMSLLEHHYRVSPELLMHLPFMPSPVADGDLPGWEARDGFVSIGNFRHPPNWDAVLYLKHTIWPLIRQRQADAVLSVYGAYPSPKAMQLNDPAEGFLVKGWADEAYPVIRAARVCLAPLRFGAGLKGKLVDAMCCGTPSVTTSIGAEGLHAGLPFPGAVTDDPAVFADRAVALHVDAAAWREARRDGLAIVHRLYDRKRLRQRLYDRISTLRDGLEAHRIDNFAGAMLRHHTMQSTRYMAQWIEAKNRRGGGPSKTNTDAGAS